MPDLESAPIDRPQTNQRQSFRCPVPDWRQEGELRIGPQKLAVRVLDESSGGFALATETEPKFESGAKGLARVGDDWHQVEVVRVMPIDLESEAEPQQETNDSCNETEEAPSQPQEPIKAYLIGIKRIGDAFNPDIKPSVIDWEICADRLKWFVPTTSATLFFGAFLVVCAVIVPMFLLIQFGPGVSSLAGDDGGATGTPRTGKGKQSSLFQQHEESNAVSPLSSLKSHSAEKAKQENVAETPNNPPVLKKIDGALKQAELTTNRSLKEMRSTLRKLPGASAFAMPDVAEALKLTEDQVRRIKEIIDVSSDAVRSLQEQLGSTDRETSQKVEQHILETARNQAKGLMTEEQRKIWEELAGETATSPKTQ